LRKGPGKSIEVIPEGKNVQQPSCVSLFEDHKMFIFASRR